MKRPIKSLCGGLMDQDWPKRFPFVCPYHPERQEGYVEIWPNEGGFLVGRYCFKPGKAGMTSWHRWNEVCSLLEGEALMANLSKLNEEE